MRKIEKINETKRWFLEKFNDIDKPLVRWAKEQRKTQITRSERKEGILILTLKK